MKKNNTLTLEQANDLVRRPITAGDIWHKRSNVHFVAGRLHKADNPIWFARKWGLERWIREVFSRAPADDGATFVCNLNPEHKQAAGKAVELRRLNANPRFDEWDEEAEELRRLNLMLSYDLDDYVEE